MRNLKKVLSLALALVMLLGMMMVGAGATDTGFADDAGIKDSFKEAAAVTKALGVMEGSNGNLNPTGKIVRAEAYILALRVDGSNANTLAANWPVTEKPFNDVSTGKWYAPYMAYGKAMGDLKGTNGYYNPDNNVTAVEYAILLLKRLGFDPARYIGDNWAANAIIDGANAKLFDGLGNISYKTHELTRQEACQMAFNAIYKYSPSGSVGYIVESGNPSTTVVFSSMLEAMLYQNGQSVKGEIKEAPAGDTLAKTVFKLEKDVATDAFGRPATLWKIDGEDACVTDGTAPVAVYTAKKSADDIAKELKGYTVAGGAASAAIALDVSVTTAVNNLVVTNGVAANLATGSSAAAQIATKTGTGAGAQVEIYANSSKQITAVVVVNYTVDTVGAVTTGSNSDGAYTQYRVGTKSGRIYENEDVADTVALYGDIAKDDVVTYAVTTDAQSNTLLHIYPTTQVEGTQTAYSTKGAVRTITVDGEKLVVANDVLNVDNDAFANGNDAGVYFLDVNNYVVAVDVPDTTETSFVVLDKIAKISGLENSYQAIIVDTEGVSSTVTVKAMKDESGAAVTLSGLNADATQSPNTNLYGIIYKASVDSKGLYTLNADTSADKSTNAGAASSDVTVTKKGSPTVVTDNSIGKITANSKTVFIVKTADGSGYKYTAYTGYNEVPTITVATANTTGLNLDYAGKASGASVIYIDARGENVTVDSNKASGDMIYVYKANDFQINGSGSSATRTYNSVVVNGEQTTVTTATDVDLTEVGLYMVTAKDGDKVTNVKAQNAGNGSDNDIYKKVVGESKFSDAGKNVITLDGTAYPYTGDEVVYFIGTDGTVTEGTPDDVKAKTDAASIKAIYVKADASNDNALESLYVIATDPASTFYTIIEKTNADGFGSSALNAVAFTNFVAKTTDDKVCAGDTITVPVTSTAKTATRGGTYKLNVNGSVVAEQTVDAGGTVADFTFTMPAENVATMTVTWEEAEYAITKVVTNGTNDVLNGLTITVTDGTNPITKAGGTDTVTVKLTGTATAAGDYTITVTKADGTAFDPAITVTTSPVSVTANADCTSTNAKTATFAMPDEAVKVTISFTTT